MFNSALAITEYISQPLGLLLVAPYLLRHLGASQFGLWMLASAAVNSGNTLSSGFGDAAIRYVAMYRGRGDIIGVERIVRNMVSINLVLGGMFALIVWCFAPYAASHIADIDPLTREVCIRSFRIGCLILIMRSIEGVFVSALRAFERYSPAVRIAMCSRIAILVAAVALVSRGRGVLDIMFVTLSIAILTLLAQGLALRSIVGEIGLMPAWHRETFFLIASYGGFSWIQAASAVVSGQADRFLVGMFLGAPAAGVYALCTQAAQTIHGIASSALNVLFPHLSSRLEVEHLGSLQPIVQTAFKVNVILTLIIGSPLVLLSHPILVYWIGPAFADKAWAVLSILAVAYMLLAINVTAHYSLLALGQVRIVTILNLIAGTAMLLLMLLVTSRYGMVGAASAKLILGPITCLLYYSLYKLMRGAMLESGNASTLVALENI